MNVPTIETANGLSLPVVGLGTYLLNGAAGVEAIQTAIHTGYRLLDSAFNYENEGAVGAAVRNCGVAREQLIVTSKLPGRHQGYEEAIDTISESVYRTGLDSIDLYLIHWPLPRLDRYVQAWRALIEARECGLVRHIGVSNFLPAHLKRLVDETGVTPEVNQIEMHPYFPQIEALAYHREHGIVTQAWSPLGRGNDLLDNPVVTEIAAVHGVSSGRVVLAWHVRLGAVPLPKAASPSRQRENLDLFSFQLTDEEVGRITALGHSDGRIAGQDPATYEEL
ncbi:aldo/keto reductase [[Mycobacterium] crassicus]|uniref:Aldo/keto reductase n=1 Tax=[Mycobacterium] crassicus TaxID=2872309 RepID=A0ABU5XIM6_9MYCO|nr:aldo/keto reductase [Mycolicibacter sp. MYC098]MEB3022135.1 aldo/keto reductase [Mycolicibacter sp. MYC098]